MHEMQTLVIDVLVLWPSIAQSVCLAVAWLRCANTAELIEVLFRVETLGDLGLDFQNFLRRS